MDAVGVEQVGQVVACLGGRVRGLETGRAEQWGEVGDARAAASPTRGQCGARMPGGGAVERALSQGRLSCGARPSTPDRPRIHSGAPERRRVGLLALGSIADAGDVELLAEAAGHPDSDVRLAAVETVVDPVGDDRAFTIIASALRDSDEQVRMAAISQLGASGRLDAVAALADAITDARPRVRTRIAYALGRLGDPSTTPALLQLLRDPDDRVRDQARDALGSVGSPTAIDVLLTEATSHDTRLRCQAAKALAKAVDADPRVASQIRLLARDDEAAVRAATLSGLASVTDPSARWSELAVTLADDPDATVRQRVAVVGHHLAPNEAGALLHRLTDDPEPIVRQTAATQLARLPH